MKLPLFVATLVAGMLFAAIAQGQQCFPLKSHAQAVVAPVVAQQVYAAPVVAAQQAYVAPQVAYSNGFEQQVVALLQQREAFKQQYAYEQQRQQAFVQALQALNGPAYPQQQPQAQTAPATQYQATAQVQHYPLAKQGNTVYGYSTFKSYVATDPLLEQRVLAQQAIKLAESTQLLTEKANGGAIAVIDAQSERLTSVAELDRKLALLDKMLAQATETRTDVNVAVTPVQPTAPPEQPVPEPPPTPTPDPGDQASSDVELELRMNEVRGLLQGKCISCHNSAKQSGMVNLEGYFEDESLRQRSYAAVAETDPEHRMPKKSGGAPGEPLPPEQVALFQYFSEL